MNKKKICVNIQDQCRSCNICKKCCTFLEENGNPAEILKKIENDPDSDLAFQCSLCGLCEEICPANFSIVEVIRNCRKESIEKNKSILKNYLPLQFYEKFHKSKLATCDSITDKTDTIFFPGCNLSSSRPHITKMIYKELQQKIPTIAIMLNCCSKPSYDLGDHDSFNPSFTSLTEKLKKKSIQTIYTACPNCFRMFNDLSDFTVKTLYDELPSRQISSNETYVIHDPCALRNNKSVHNSVRNKLNEMKINITEKKHSRSTTSCCGEGGAVSFVKKEYAQDWIRLTKDESNGKTVLTYCSGCTGFFNQEMNSVHILDLMYNNIKNGKPKYFKTPLTYVMKLKLKFTIKIKTIFTNF